MKSIIINYKLKDSVTNEKLQKIVSSCKSNKHKVKLNIYDFSLDKNLSKQVQDVDIRQDDDSYLDIHVLTKNYEDYGESNSEIYKNIIPYADSTAFALIESQVMFKNNALDELDFSIFEDTNIGCLYFDYDYIHNDLRTRIYLCSSNTTKNIPIPLLIFSTQKLIENMSHENSDQQTFASSVTKHIPKSLCDVIV